MLPRGELRMIEVRYATPVIERNAGGGSPFTARRLCVGRDEVNAGSEHRKPETLLLVSLVARAWAL